MFLPSLQSSKQYHYVRRHYEQLLLFLLLVLILMLVIVIGKIEYERDYEHEQE
jgi:hypothetical protein